MRSSPVDPIFSLCFGKIDTAFVAALYGARYISDRFLPDKAIDLVDEAASALRLAQESKPDELEALDRAIVTLQIELESLKKESDTFSVERRVAVEADIKTKREQASEMLMIWQTGKSGRSHNPLTFTEPP